MKNRQALPVTGPLTRTLTAGLTTTLTVGLGTGAEQGFQSTVYFEDGIIYDTSTDEPMMLRGFNQGHGELTPATDAQQEYANNGFTHVRMLSRNWSEQSAYTSGTNNVSNGEGTDPAWGYMLQDYVEDFLDLRVNEAVAAGLKIGFVQDSNCGQGKLGQAACTIGGNTNTNFFRAAGATKKAEFLARWAFIANRYKGKIAWHELHVEPFSYYDRIAVTMTIASPAVFTSVAHGYTNGQRVYFETTGALPTGLTAGQDYFVRNAAADTFNVSTTVGGALVNTSGSQSGTHGVSGQVLQSAQNAFYIECADAVLAVNPDANVCIGTVNAYDIDIASGLFTANILAWMAAHPNRLMVTANMLNGASTSDDNYQKVAGLRDIAVANSVPWYVNQLGTTTAADPNELDLKPVMFTTSANGGHWAIWEHRGIAETEFGVYWGPTGTENVKAARKANIEAQVGYDYDTLETAAVAAATAAGSTHFIYLKEDLSNVFQQIDGTVPCTAAGDRVGFIGAVVGTINLAAPANDTTRGILRRAPGGKGWRVELDGSTNYYIASSTFYASGDTNQQMMVAGRAEDSAAIRVAGHSGNATTNARHPYVALSAGDLATVNWRGDDTVLRSVTGTLVMSGRAGVFEAIKEGNNKDGYLEGSTFGAQDTGAVGTLSAQNRTRFGASTTAGSHWNGTQSAWLMSKTLTVLADRRPIARFMAWIEGAPYQF